MISSIFTLSENKYLILNMKRIILFVVSIITLMGCNDSNLNITDNKDVKENVYFVRYISDNPIGTASYTNEEGKTITIRNVTGSNGVFERTVGPVYSGFTCSFSMDRGTGVYDLPVRIEVKRNEDPFVIKVEGLYRVRYTIE